MPRKKHVEMEILTALCLRLLCDRMTNAPRFEIEPSQSNDSTLSPEAAARRAFIKDMATWIATVGFAGAFVHQARKILHPKPPVQPKMQEDNKKDQPVEEKR